MSYEIILDISTNETIKRNYTEIEIAESENNLKKLNAEKERLQIEEQARLKVIEKLKSLGLDSDDLYFLGIKE